MWQEHYSARNVYSKFLQIELPHLFTLNSTEEYLGVCFMHGGRWYTSKYDNLQKSSNLLALILN